MIEFGKTLREAREKKGYSASQIAEITKLAPSIVADLENDDFSRIAAPIYGRGFIKLYCQAAGLDAKPLIDEFMARYNSSIDEPSPLAPVQPPPKTCQIKDEPTEAIQTDEVAHEDSPIEATTETPSIEPPINTEPPKTYDLFSAAHTTFDAAPNASNTAENDNITTETDPLADCTLSRYAAPLRQFDNRLQFSSINWRLVLLIVAALGLLILFIFAIRSLYQATTRESIETQEQPVEVRTPTATPTPSSSAPRQQQKIPDIYLD